MRRKPLSVALSLALAILVLTSTVAVGAVSSESTMSESDHDSTANETDSTDATDAAEVDGWERAISAVQNALEDGELNGDFWHFLQSILSGGEDDADRPTTPEPEQPTTEPPETTASTPDETTTTETPDTTTQPESTTTPETTTTESPETTTTEPTTTPDESDGFDRSEVERYVHQFVNEERTERGLNAISFDTELRDIARGHSEDMATRNYFSHTSPEGENFADRYEQAGYICQASTGDGSYLTGGENIAQTWYDTPINSGDETVRYTTERELARGIVDQWMNSQGHRENILTDSWQNEGIGIYVTEDGQVYATQNFC
ncbi:CAP domain-containing protein [Haladaptatus cibarius]|uniref:CAP domain-containing protein n=1 Tax=Haladaptatus cibarius TaxID=453847 RepID=UPI0006795B95|nr:CAP domain-containing protein [Haladaptatus cibarius]